MSDNEKELEQISECVYNTVSLVESLRKYAVDGIGGVTNNIRRLENIITAQHDTVESLERRLGSAFRRITVLEILLIAETCYFIYKSF